MRTWPIVSRIGHSPLPGSRSSAASPSGSRSPWSDHRATVDAAPRRAPAARPDTGRPPATRRPARGRPRAARTAGRSRSGRRPRTTSPATTSRLRVDPPARRPAAGRPTSTAARSMSTSGASSMAGEGDQATRSGSMGARSFMACRVRCLDGGSRVPRPSRARLLASVLRSPRPGAAARRWSRRDSRRTPGPATSCSTSTVEAAGSPMPRSTASAAPSASRRAR